MTSDFVMAGLVGVPARKRAGCPVPAIHAFRALPRRKDVDARDKRGHDGGAQLCRGTKS
jgi:hypothetical protein